MANYRYNFKVSSPLYAGRNTSFLVYAASDSTALAAASLIEAELANNAKVQVSRVIREPNDPDASPPRSTECDAADVEDTDTETFSFQNTADLSKRRYSMTVDGLKDTADKTALAASLAALSPHLLNLTGDDMDSVVSSSRGFNLVSGGRAARVIKPSG